MIGEVIGNYRIVSELGKGGMGVLYRAEHVQLARPAALKMLLPALAADAELVQRFFHEAKAAAAIDHPGIVEIYDFGTHTDGSAYIVMELLKGETLLDRLRKGPILPAEGAGLIAQVAGALAAAHAQHIVHRDLKPDNVFLTPNDMIPGGIQVKLLDFGIAKLPRQEDERGGTFKTQTGALIGTPAYMSPEQCMGKADLDHRTDLYSLGCILFHVLCGRPPFLSEHGSGVLIAAHMRDPAPPPRSLAPDLSPALEAIVLKLLEKEPDARFASATELRAALVAAGADAPATQVLAAQTSFAPTLPGKTIATPTTTRTGAAAEVVAAAPTAAPAPAPASPVKWLAIGGAAVAAAGIAAFLIVRSSKDKAAAPPPDAAPVVAIDAAPAIVVDATPMAVLDATPIDAAPIDAVPIDAAPALDATAMGAPDGASAALPMATDAGAAAVAPTFTLAATTLAPGAAIDIQFAAPMHAATGERYWITVVSAALPDTQWGAYVYVADGATTAALTAPATAGDYEVRLHANYPVRVTNVVSRVAIRVE